jgi:3-oxoacyl-[acyl-carrier-protein] synthase II
MYTRQCHHARNAGIKQCINRTLKASGISAQEVDYVNAHATSTQAGDMVSEQTCSLAYW